LIRLRSFRRRGVVALVATTLIACARNRAEPKPLAGDATFAFTAETPADTVLTGTFAGTATIHDQYISVVIPRASISFPAGEAMRWRGLVIHAFVAADFAGGSWRAPVESRPTNLWRFLDFPPRPLAVRTSIALNEPLRFLVPIPPGTDLAKARLALEIEWVSLFARTGETVLKYGQPESNIAFSGPIVLSRPADH
jgi:hypothetical protein